MKDDQYQQFIQNANSLQRQAKRGEVHERENTKLLDIQKQNSQRIKDLNEKLRAAIDKAEVCEHRCNELTDRLRKIEDPELAHVRS